MEKPMNEGNEIRPNDLENLNWLEDEARTPQGEVDESLLGLYVKRERLWEDARDRGGVDDVKLGELYKDIRQRREDLGMPPTYTGESEGTPDQ